MSAVLLVLLWSTLAWGQEAPAAEPAPAGAEPPAAEPPAGTEAPADTGQAGQDGEPSGGSDTGQAGDAPSPVEVSPPVWTTIPTEERFVDEVPQLGPWPDDWRPEQTGQAGLPTIDVVLGDELDAGRPYQAGPALGPTPPVELLGPIDHDLAAPPSPERPPPALAPAPEVTTAPTGPAPPEPAPAAAPPPASPGDQVAPAEGPLTGPDLSRHSFAEDFLPPPPRSGGRRAVLFFALAVLCLLGAAVTERLQERVPPSGALPRLLSALTGAARGATIPLVLVAALSLLPRSWSLAVPFALVALAFALGWSARELLADMFAGIVLTVENRVRQGERLELGPHRGVVYSLGLRTTRITVDDGRVVSIPNRHLLSETLRVDPDPYAPVVVPVPVHPHLTVGEVRQMLQELALLSPYVAPSRPPNVYRDADRPDVWIVEARLVHPRYANAFRGSLVELADEQLNLRKPQA